MRVDRLQQLMKKQGHNSASLAEAIGRSDRTIRYILSRDGNTSDDTVIALAQALNVSADFLLGLSDDPMPHLRIDNMTEDERRVVAAMRQGDKLEAIRVLVNDE
jgi:plasmid maintenance system antidote protein VapI